MNQWQALPDGSQPMTHPSVRYVSRTRDGSRGRPIILSCRPAYREGIAPAQGGRARSHRRDVGLASLGIRGSPCRLIQALPLLYAPAVLEHSNLLLPINREQYLPTCSFSQQLRTRGSRLIGIWVWKLERCKADAKKSPSEEFDLAFDSRSIVSPAKLISYDQLACDTGEYSKLSGKTIIDLLS